MGQGIESLFFGLIMSVGDDLETVLAPCRSSWLRRVWRYGPIVVWIALIFWASTDQFSSEHTGGIIRPWIEWLFPGMSPDGVEKLHDVIRKAAHVTEYAIFALLVARALIGSSLALFSRGWLAISLLLLAAVAATDEYHQSFVPSRTAAIADVFIDMSGGLVALAILAVWRLARRNRSTQRKSS
jgi:VanZ family protein